MTHIKAFAFSSVVVLLSGLLVSRAQESAPAEDATLAAAAVEHPECSYFARRDKFQTVRPDYASTQRTVLTLDVVKHLSVASGKSAKSFEQPDTLATIDKYLYADMQAHGVAPADKTNDFEFIRRVTLD